MKKGTRLKMLTEDIVRDYENGQSIRAIAAKYGYSKTSIRNILDGLVEIRPRNTLTKKDKGDIIQRYLKGETILEIRKQYSIGEMTVKKVLLEAGVYNVNINYIQDIHAFNKVVEMYGDGMSLSEISKEFGLSKTTINNYIILNRIKCRSYKAASYNAIDVYLEYFKTMTDIKAEHLGFFVAKLNFVESGNSRIFNTVENSMEKRSQYERMMQPWVEQVSWSEESEAFCKHVISQGEVVEYFKNRVYQDIEGFESAFVKGIWKRGRKKKEGMRIVSVTNKCVWNYIDENLSKYMVKVGNGLYRIQEIV